MIGLGSDKKKKRQRLRQGKRQRQTLDREVCDDKASGDVALRGLEALIHRTWTPRTSRRAVNSLNIFCRPVFSVPSPAASDFSYNSRLPMSTHYETTLHFLSTLLDIQVLLVDLQGSLYHIVNWKIFSNFAKPGPRWLVLVVGERKSQGCEMRNLQGKEMRTLQILRTLRILRCQEIVQDCKLHRK